MDAENKIPIEDEVQVELAHLDILIDEINDTEVLKEVMGDIIYLQDKIRGKITNLYRTNKQTHYLCRRHITKDGSVVYGHGTPYEDGRPLIVCQQCTELKGSKSGT